MTGNGNYTAADRLRAMLAAELRLGLEVLDDDEVPAGADMATLWLMTNRALLDGKRPFNLTKSFAYAEVLDMIRQDNRS